MDASKARELREFVEACKKDPSLLADPNLAFFRDYLERSAASPPSLLLPVPSICMPRVHLI
jgi:suppressor of tumorigenicity protein 13